jgi:hypothetical protein
MMPGDFTIYLDVTLIPEAVGEEGTFIPEDMVDRPLFLFGFYG